MSKKKQILQSISTDLTKGECALIYLIGIHSLYNEVNGDVKREVLSLSNHELEDYGNLYQKLQGAWNDNSIDQPEIINKLYTSYRLRTKHLWRLIMLDIFG